jgi:hypothetical protein
MMKRMALAVAGAAAIAGCRASEAPTRDTVHIERLDCSSGSASATHEPCRQALQDYFRAHGNARIAGVEAYYEGPRIELVVSTSKSSWWPLARRLHIEDVTCAGPGDCAAEIGDLSLGRPPRHHAFIVPIYVDAGSGQSGTRQLLDIQVGEGAP